VASREDRKDLARHLLEEVPEVICWQAKRVLLALEFANLPNCSGLVDPQVGLWLLDTDEITTLEQALRVYQIPKTESQPRQIDLLYRAVKRALEANDLFLPFVKQEMPLVCVLAFLEQTGILFDQEKAVRYTKEISAKMELLQSEADALIGRHVNIGSAQQMATVLYDELGLQTVKKKKTAGGARLALTKG
jgi:DNA polymerase-1